MTLSFDINKLVPSSSLHLVQLCDPADRTGGGIFLPEMLQQNYCEATIKRSGPGWSIPDSDRYALSWTHVDWKVIFQQHHYQPLYRGATVGFVQEENILGIVLDDSLKPLNDWVKVTVD